MCGRSTLHDAPTNILERFQLPPMLPGFVPRYNIAPSQLQWAVVRESGLGPATVQLKWGLVPSWAADPSVGNKMINARAESLAERPSFKDSLRDRRCVILADGYYEWKSVRKERVPMYFRLDDGRAFGIAGLWDRWEKGAAPLETCTVITTDAGTRASSVHHRMPVLLIDDAVTRWLDGSISPREVRAMLQPYDGADLEMYEVARTVNSPLIDSLECITRVQGRDIAEQRAERS